MRVTDRSHPPVARRRRPATGPVTAPAPALRARTVLVLVALTAVLGGTGLAAGAQADPTVAPVTTVSPDGRTGTDGTRTLALSQAGDLDPAGATMSVAGSGYDENKGVYVALCVIPPRSYVPSPCGGGVDTEGTQGAAQWISSNPPSYGIGLAQPYGPGGSFSTSFVVRADIAPGIDCRQVRCAIVTRSDHTRTSDRSQDIIVPVAFRTAPMATTAPPAIGPDPAPTVPPGGVAPTTAAPTVTVPPLANPTTTVPAPAATVAADGLSVSDGTRTLGLSRSTELDPTSDALTVSGQGFDEARGIYVSLCAVPADGAAPGPCRTGSPAANRWVSSDPPDYGVGVAQPFGAAGTFEVELTVEAVIDTATDCRTVACAVVTRADDTAPDDRTLDLVLPVSFAATSPSTTTAPATEPETAAGPEDETEEASSVVIQEASSTTGPVLAVVLVAVVLALAAGAVLLARRRAPAGHIETTDPRDPTDPAAPAGSSRRSSATEPADPSTGAAPGPAPDTGPEDRP